MYIGDESIGILPTRAATRVSEFIVREKQTDQKTHLVTEFSEYSLLVVSRYSLIA
jgi:hypothetical protein